LRRGAAGGWAGVVSLKPGTAAVIHVAGRPALCRVCLLTARPRAPPGPASPRQTWTEAILAEDASGGLDSFDTERSLRRRSFAPSAGARTPTAGSPAAAWFAPPWGDGGGGGPGSDGDRGGDGLAGDRAASLGSKSAASGAAAAAGAPVAGGGAVELARAGSGAARPGPAEANVASAGGAPLPHSSSTPALPLPPPGHGPAPEMSQPSSLLTEDDVRSLAGGCPAPAHAAGSPPFGRGG
jgi:hypothetical protein